MSMPTSTLMMKTRLVSETLVFNLALARLNARDNFIALIRRGTSLIRGSLSDYRFLRHAQYSVVQRQ